MSIHEVVSPRERKRVAHARAEGLGAITPPPKVLGWDVRWRQEPGGRRPTSFRFPKSDGYNLDDAQELEIRIRRRKRATHGYAYRSDVLNGHRDAECETLRHFLLEVFMPFVRSERRPSTVRSYANAIDNRILELRQPGTKNLGRIRVTEIADRPLDLITTDDLLEWRQALFDAGIGRRQIGVAVEVLRSALSYAVERRRIARNPALGIRGLTVPRRDRYGAKPQAPIKPDRVVDPADIETFRVYLERHSWSPRNSVAVAVMGYLGLRPNEVCALRWGDLLSHDGAAKATIWVERGLSDDQELAGPKGGDPRMVQVFKPVAEAIEDYYNAVGRPDRDAFFCPRHDGGMLRADLLSQRLIRHMRRAHIPRFRPYDLRHTAASLLGTCGDESKPGVPWTIPEIAAQLGHSVATCARIYLHVLKNPLYRGMPIEAVIRHCRAAAQARP